MESLGLQTVTLSDGTTAYIQQAVKGEKLLEGQVIQLEDGTTAYIHQVTLQKEPLAFEDGQPVQLEDGSVAYIHHTPKEGYDPSTLEAVQLEDGSTAYIHHPVTASDSTILAVQTEVGLEDLATEDEEGFNADTVVALEQYASKVEPSTAQQLSKPCIVTSLEGKKGPVLSMAYTTYLLCPSTLVPSAHLSHFTIQAVRHSLTRLLTSVYIHCINAVFAEGRQL